MRIFGKDVGEVKREIYVIVKRINECYGSFDYKFIVLIDCFVFCYEKSVYYVVVDCCLVNAVRDGMNLVFYKYIVCR